MLDIEEKALVEQAQRDPQAFAALYDRYVERIYAFAYRRTQDEAAAEDVTSVTFEKALRHIRSYRWQGVSFGAWLYRIALAALKPKPGITGPWFVTWLPPQK